MEKVLFNDQGEQVGQDKAVELDATEFSSRTSAPVEYYPIQKYNSGLIHYDYSVAQNQMELVGDRYSYFATPLYSNSSGLVGFGIATDEGRLDYVIDKGKFNDFTRNIDSYYLAADWGSTMSPDHIAYFEAIKSGDWGTAWSSGKNIVGAEYTFANLLSSASSVGAYANVTRGLSRNSLPKNLNPNEIHFMQNSISNITGNYTVLGNAEALANGSLKPNVLRMNVWKDANGKVWTLDHRRLGAFRLSGLNKAPVKWASPSQVESQMWKMNPINGGKSIKLRGTGKIIN